MLLKNKLTEPDEYIDTKTQGIDNTKTEDMSINKT